MSDSAVLWTTEQVARRLGVRPATVYAYVSRGVLHSVRDPSGRGSLFRADEVERLAQRRTPKRAAKHPGPLIGTALTRAGEGRLFYRGHDVTDLARTQHFEAVANLLWTGRLHSPTTFSAPPEAVCAARAATAALPPTARRLDHSRITTAVMPAITSTALASPSGTFFAAAP